MQSRIVFLHVQNALLRDISQWNVSSVVRMSKDVLRSPILCTDALWRMVHLDVFAVRIPPHK